MFNAWNAFGLVFEKEAVDFEINKRNVLKFEIKT